MGRPELRGRSRTRRPRRRHRLCLFRRRCCTPCLACLCCLTSLRGLRVFGLGAFDAELHPMTPDGRGLRAVGGLQPVVPLLPIPVHVTYGLEPRGDRGRRLVVGWEAQGLWHAADGRGRSVAGLFVSSHHRSACRVQFALGRDLQVPFGLRWARVEVCRFDRPAQVFVHLDEGGPNGIGSGDRGLSRAGFAHWWF